MPTENLERKRDTTALRDHPHPSVAVDVVLLSVHERSLRVLLAHRDEDPVGWALPGRFVRENEDLAHTVHVALSEKAGLQRQPRLYPLRPFGDPRRDSRGHVISLPHVALIDYRRFGLTTLELARTATVTVNPRGVQVRMAEESVRLQFDHERILREAVEEVRRRLELGETQLAAELLPSRFTLRTLRHVYEAVSGHPINKDSFRRRMADKVVPTGEFEDDVDHRPAEFHVWK